MTTYGDSGERETVIEDFGSSNPESLTPWQAHYLHRLEHAANLKSSYEAAPGSEEWLLKAINKAIYSAYRSCVEHGAEVDARAVLSRGH